MRNAKLTLVAGACPQKRALKRARTHCYRAATHLHRQACGTHTPVFVQVIRLLDPQGEILKREHLRHHLVCVSRDAKKSLHAALHHPIDAVRYKRNQDTVQNADDIDDDDGVDEDETVRCS